MGFQRQEFPSVQYLVNTWSLSGRSDCLEAADRTKALKPAPTWTAQPGIEALHWSQHVTELGTAMA